MFVGICFGVWNHIPCMFFLGSWWRVSCHLGQDLMRSWWLLCRGWRAGCALEALIGVHHEGFSVWVLFQLAKRCPFFFNVGVSNNYPLKDRVVNYINHPFWGIPILETPMCFSFVMKNRWLVNNWGAFAEKIWELWFYLPLVVAGPEISRCWQDSGVVSQIVTPAMMININSH